jgi:hypothetical protein
MMKHCITEYFFAQGRAYCSPLVGLGPQAGFGFGWSRLFAVTVLHHRRPPRPGDGSPRPLRGRALRGLHAKIANPIEIQLCRIAPFAVASLCDGG